MTEHSRMLSENDAHVAFTHAKTAVDMRAIPSEIQVLTSERSELPSTKSEGSHCSDAPLLDPCGHAKSIFTSNSVILTSSVQDYSRLPRSGHAYS